MSDRLTPEREQRIRYAVAAYTESHPNLGFACCSAHGAADGARELLAELDRVRDELAEEKALHDTRLRGLLVKAAPDRDLYVLWSNVCDMPAGAWSREEALAYGFPRSHLDQADKAGSSSRRGYGDWDDSGFVAEQRGWLKRDRLGDYAQLWLADRLDEAYALLEPFDNESEVRR